jgi:hypothetical protein
MSNLLKSTVLGVALLAGIAATAHAQSVSALPPTSPATAPSVATTPAYSSSKIYPNPGNGVTWQEEHYQATGAQDPYSRSIGPQPGNQSSLAPLPGDAPQANATNEPGQRPYSTTHFGPAPN